MRRRRSMDANAESNEVNLTPMLDVVFIMLIFFIVTTSFIKESGIEIERPESSAAKFTPGSAGAGGYYAWRKGAVWVDGKPVDVHHVGREVAGSDRARVCRDSGGLRYRRPGCTLKLWIRLKEAGVEQVAVAASRSAP